MRYRYDRIKRRLYIKRMLYRCKDTADHCYAAVSEKCLLASTQYMQPILQCTPVAGWHYTR